MPDQTSPKAEGKTFSGEIFLGDGLYVRQESPDEIRLRAPRMYEDHVVYMNRTVLFNFILYLASLGGLAKEIADICEKQAEVIRRAQKEEPVTDSNKK